MGEEALKRLSKAHVAVFGIGGVGGFACEALVRSGIGSFDLVDSDRVSISNLNRQIIATQDTVGLYKVDVMAQRMRTINPEVSVRVRPCFFLPETAEDFSFPDYDYVIDAVDTVSAKIEIILRAKQAGVPVISCMGAGNKLDAAAFRVADLSATRVCPLAKVMRRELKKRGVEHVKVVYSEESPRKPLIAAGSSGERDPEESSEEGTSGKGRRAVPGSVAFVPSVAGLIAAGEVVKDLIRDLL